VTRNAWHSAWLLVGLTLLASWARGQDDGIERPGPPERENFETDADRDGVPDGWYNVRDARFAPGGVIGKRCLRFENLRPGRQARISRAFGVDGKKTEAIVIGLWVRLEHVQSGERVSEDPGLAIDFLGPGLKRLSEGTFGPWTKTVGDRWTRVAKRFPVPPDTLDAIMSTGLLGATGTMDIDALTIDLVPVGGQATTNLLMGGDFELGDPEPYGWTVDHGARRSHPGRDSDSALELSSSGARAMNGLGVTVDRLPRLEVTMRVKASRLRIGAGVEAAFFFLDADGQILPQYPRGVPLRVQPWQGTFEWRRDQTVVEVPRDAIRAALQFEKADAVGSLWIDDVTITASPTPSAGQWTPYHIQTETASWMPFPPSTSIAAGSALDASFLIPASSTKDRFVQVREGRLGFEKGGRARFFGVTLLPPTAFLDAEHADLLVERLARSGVNLVRLGDLDMPLGPGRCLFDDTRDDTRALDPVALARLDHMIAALKAKGIHIALELLSGRRFREGDEIEGFRDLPPGGGPAAAFDPKIQARIREAAEAFLTHVNPETGLPLRSDPVLAWVTVAGEQSLFDLVEHPDSLTTESAKLLKELGQKHGNGPARRFWQATESSQWKSIAEDLRRIGVKVPIAGGSHWRRLPAEYLGTNAAPGLDLIDDRLFWDPGAWSHPERQAMVRDLDGGLATLAGRKRHLDRPYVVGQWCDLTRTWALPYEAADLMLAAQTAATEDWDALVRRAVFLYPEQWGANATGTGGVDDIFPIPEIVNGNPQVFAFLPHAASLILRGHDRNAKGRAAARPAVPRRTTIPGWDPALGRLSIDSPYTQALVGWPEGRSANFEALAIDVDNVYAVVAATSIGAEPIAESRRLLVSAIGRIEPTGLRWTDEWRRDMAAHGQAPLLQEPVRARVLWRRQGKVKAYALDNTGARTGPATLEKTDDGVKLVIDGKSPTVHWELAVE
jgi:hypothetical protein